ncbi:MAG: amidase [Chloroflexota bacterium]
MPAARSVEEASIAMLRDWLDSGTLSTRQIVDQYLERIRTMDAGPRGLRSVIETNPDALAIADERDRERRAGVIRGPLHGIPILLKDNIDTADRTLTTAGSLALIGSRPREDATVARKLREAGAVLLGKTNMSEWANFRSTRSSSGWSGRGRQCRNPYALDRTPGGSSSGSGVAAAASLCAAAIGTETSGSIVSPASASGVVGIKPTVGLTSRAGVIPISHTQDTIGPLARSVADAALVLGAIVGADARDSATGAGEGRAIPDYTACLDAGALRGARIGVARARHFGYSEHVDRVVDAAIDRIRDAGATIVDPADLPTGEALAESASVREVLLYEFKAGLNAYLAERGDPRIRTLAHVIAFNREHADVEMPYFRQELLEMAEERGPLTDTTYLDALATNQRLAGPEGIDAVMDRYTLDVLVVPTMTVAATIDQVNGDRRLGNGWSAAALVGYPYVSLPVGYAPFGLPVSMTLIGRPWSEPRLIGLAYAVERIVPQRQPPSYLPMLDLD